MPVLTEGEISDYDGQIIITSVMKEFHNMANPTTDVVLAIYRSSMRCYLRGRNIDFTNLLLSEVMSLVADEAMMNARHLQHADAIAHRQTVVRIWVWV